MAITIYEIDTTNKLKSFLDGLGNKYFESYEFLSEPYESEDKYGIKFYGDSDHSKSFVFVASDEQIIPNDIPSEFIALLTGGTKRVQFTDIYSNKYNFKSGKTADAINMKHIVRCVTGQNFAMITYRDSIISPSSSTPANHSLVFSKTENGKTGVAFISAGESDNIFFRIPVLLTGSMKYCTETVAPVDLARGSYSSPELSVVGLINIPVAEEEDYCTGMFRVEYSGDWELLQAQKNTYGSIVTINGDEYYTIYYPSNYANQNMYCWLFK